MTYQSILHVWDQVGVACIIAKFQRKTGYQVDILKDNKSDPFKFLEFYNEKPLDITGNIFFREVIKKAKNYDLIHVHAQYDLIPILKKKYPQKFIIMHYHGFELLHRINDDFRRYCDCFADLILVSTLNLQGLIPNSVYLPNPVDTEHFKKIPNVNQNKKAFIFAIGYLSTSEIVNYINKCPFKVQYDLIDRDKSSVSYSELPKLFNKYSMYIDVRIRDGVVLKALSKTALEGLASGLEVLNYDYQIMKDLPLMHYPEYAVSKLDFLYKNIIKKPISFPKDLNSIKKKISFNLKLFRKYRTVFFL